MPVKIGIKFEEEQSMYQYTTGTTIQEIKNEED